jgi:hypothetical protein
MTRTIQLPIQVLPILAAGVFAGFSCSSTQDNQPSVNNQMTTPSTTGGTSSVPAASGGTSPGATTGGTPSAGVAAGGTTSAAGGTPPAAAGTTAGGGSTSNAGAPPTNGGTSAAGGNASGGGAAPTAGAGAFVFPDGACGKTKADEDIAKGVACTADDVQKCDKTCGPANVGYKTETCTDATYAEGDCTFPSDANYACFGLADPPADAEGCPTDAPPQHNQPCSLAICQTAAIGKGCAQTTACGVCGVATGYLDSGGSSKTGYCICIAGANGGKWACGSTSAWPCPAGNGC